jgi:phage repressor protein C with HTH and peptisase S24 domain
MSILDYEILRQGLRAYAQEGTYKDLERKSGISSSNIGRIADSQVKRPSLETWSALHRAAPELIPPPPVKGRADLPPELAADPEISAWPDLHRVPVFNAGAGEPSGFSDGGYPVGEAEDFIYLPQEVRLGRNAFAIKVCGQSMEPEIMMGDIVVVDPDWRLENGQVCFATWSDDDFGQRLVKIYHEENGRIMLLSRNPLHGPVVLDPEKDRGVRIYKVVGHYKRL